MGLAEGTSAVVGDSSVFAMMSLLKARGDLTGEEEYIGRAKDHKPEVLKSNLQQQATAVLGKHPSRAGRRGAGRSGGRRRDSEYVLLPFSFSFSFSFFSFSLFVFLFLFLPYA